MDDLGVIDRFTNVFSHYIDGGFGLLGGEVAFLTATLVALDMALAGIFWALGGEEVIGKLLRKILYVGAFAFILTNFNELSGIIFRSFAGLGLTASGTDLTAGELLRPGRLAGVGVDAARPILKQIGELTGFPDLFLNLDTVLVLFFAWLVVIVSFFVLAVQLFVTLIEFKLTTLAGFVLVPFALWGKTAFLAERVLGNVVSSGIKVLVLAVIVGIGTGIFGEFTAPPGVEPTIDHALAIMLASLALLGLGLFGPGIATGLVSGAPQLGAGAAAGTALAAGGLGVAAGAAVAGTAIAGGAAVSGAARLAATHGPGAVRATASLASGSYGAFKEGFVASGTSGAPAAAAGVFNMARAGGAALAKGVRNAASRFRSAAASSTTAAGEATATATHSSSESSGPAWARALHRRSNVARGAATAAHVTRSTDRPGSGANPNLSKEE